MTVQPGTELYLFPHLLQGADFTMNQAGDHHVEAVGAHVDCSEQFWRGGGRVGRHVY